MALETSIKKAIYRYYHTLEVPQESAPPEIAPIEVIESDTEMILTHIDHKPPLSPSATPPTEANQPRTSEFPTEAVLKAAVKILIRKGVITYEELKEEVKKEEGS